VLAIIIGVCGAVMAALVAAAVFKALTAATERFDRFRSRPVSPVRMSGP
jgi:hypothetical protein